MKDKQEYIDDLREIREIMDRSTRFISLSGLSGVSAGIIGMVGAFIAYREVFRDLGDDDHQSIPSEDLIFLILLALITLLLALVAGWFFTAQKARKDRQRLVDSRTRRMIGGLSVPLVSGGLICLLLLLRGQIEYAIPLSLVFYGLGLVSAGAFTLSEVRSLGIMQILLGILGCYFTTYGLMFWGMGFGMLHIVYGIFMHRKYGS